MNVEETKEMNAKEKKKINIALKTKVLPDSVENTVTTTSEASTMSSDNKSNQTPKVHEENLLRWSKRVRESDSITTGFVLTTTGKPACLLCKRKFVSTGSFDRHQQVSRLHKAKLSAWMAVRRKRELEYRDRAEERRVLHGIDNGPHPATRIAIDEREISHGEQPTEFETVGTQMLRKIGWSSGHVSKRGAADGGLGSQLYKDWDRIEAMAAASTKKEHPNRLR